MIGEHIPYGNIDNNNTTWIRPFIEAHQEIAGN
jgi:hypothetical protein